jgi:hypothetical protein
MIRQTESESPQPVAEAENLVGVASTALLARSSVGWNALTAKANQYPVVRILSDADFDAQIDKRSSAYKSYPSSEAGTADYSEMHACILRFYDGPDELLIRESLLANAIGEARADSASPPKPPTQ